MPVKTSAPESKQEDVTDAELKVETTISNNSSEKADVAASNAESPANANVPGSNKEKDDSNNSNAESPTVGADRATLVEEVKVDNGANTNKSIELGTPSFVVNSAHKTIRACLKRLRAADEVTDEFMSLYRRLLSFLDVHTKQEDEVIFPFFDSFKEGATSNAGLAQEHQIEAVWTQLINRKIKQLCQLIEEPDEDSHATERISSLSTLILQQVKAWSISHENHLSHEEKVTLKLAKELSDPTNLASNKLFKKVISFDIRGFADMQLPLMIENAETIEEIKHIVIAVKEASHAVEWKLCSARIGELMKDHELNTEFENLNIDLMSDIPESGSVEGVVEDIELTLGKLEKTDGVSWIRVALQTMKLLVVECECNVEALTACSDNDTAVRDCISSLSTSAVALDSCLIPLLSMVNPVICQHVREYPGLDIADFEALHETFDPSSTLPQDFMHLVNSTKTSLLRGESFELAPVVSSLNELVSNFKPILTATVNTLSELKEMIERGGPDEEFANKCFQVLSSMDEPELFYDTILPQLFSTLKRWGLFYAQKQLLAGLQVCCDGVRYDHVKEVVRVLVDDTTWLRWSEEHLDGEGQLVGAILLTQDGNQEEMSSQTMLGSTEDIDRSFGAFEYVRVSDAVFRRMYEEVSRHLNELSIVFDIHEATHALVKLDKLLRLTIMARERFAVVETRWDVLQQESDENFVPSSRSASGSAHSQQGEKLVGIVRFVRDKVKECILLTEPDNAANRHQKLCGASETFATWVEGVRNLTTAQRSIINKISKLLHAKSGVFKESNVYLVDELVHDMVDAIRSEFLDLELPIIMENLLDSRPVGSIALFLTALQLSSTKLEYEAIKNVTQTIVGQGTWEKVCALKVCGDGKFSLANKAHKESTHSNPAQTTSASQTSPNQTGCGCNCTIS